MVGILGMVCCATGCQKNTVPQTNFPLQEETILTTLEKAELKGEISESETVTDSEGQSAMHVVRSINETYSDTITSEEAQTNPHSRVMIAGISSRIAEGEQLLSVTYDQKEVPDEFAWKDWKKQIVFATLLYGGFEDEEEIYKAFLDKKIPENETVFELAVQLPGRYCWMHYDASETHKICDEYGIPIGKSRSGTMILKICESKALFQKQEQDYKEKIDSNME